LFADPDYPVDLSGEVQKNEDGNLSVATDLPTDQVDIFALKSHNLLRLVKIAKKYR